eukprot:6460098-Pyramimonas_sp.AAC.1
MEKNVKSMPVEEPPADPSVVTLAAAPTWLFAIVGQSGGHYILVYGRYTGGGEEAQMQLIAQIRGCTGIREVYRRWGGGADAADSPDTWMYWYTGGGGEGAQMQLIAGIGRCTGIREVAGARTASCSGDANAAALARQAPRHARAGLLGPRSKLPATPNARRNAVLH